ncbi:phage holin family protein [Williamsia muralis]|uniref:Superfamily III holin-X n=1 Tax=Williamsia marianensis TaxID=85044 RepID=A0A2G3PIS3_WILMA|nr:phage holin family protein [Williamsia marianensis]PHV65714.1 hypothetical protein CSW57_18495 [Williamsia marianensis]
MNQPPPTDLSTVQLIERLSEQTSTLVKTEVRDALDEVKTKGIKLGIGVGISGAGALLLLFGFGTLIAAAVLGLATAVDPWLAALIVAAVLVVIGAIAAAIGASRAKKAVPPAPQATVHSIQRDINTVREHL